MPKTYKNILIIKMSSLGDIIHALPSLYALRKAYPEARITWAVHPAFAGILPGKPWIDEVYLAIVVASDTNDLALHGGRVNGNGDRQLLGKL